MQKKRKKTKTVIHLTKNKGLYFLPPFYNWYFMKSRSITCKIIIDDRLILVKFEGLITLTVCKEGCSQLVLLYITLGQLCMLKSCRLQNAQCLCTF